MVKHLGYAIPKTGFAMYWCIPGKSIDDGLQVVSLETHARAMVAASQQNKVLIVFIDHNNMLEKQLWDDVLLQKVELPTVISPVKTSYVHEQRGGPSARTYGEHLFSMYRGPHVEDAGEKEARIRRNIFPNTSNADAVMGRKGQEKVDCAGANEQFYEAGADEEYYAGEDSSEEEEYYGGTDTSSDSDFADSDYDFEDGDDALYDTNVDKDLKDELVAEKRKGKKVSEELEEEDVVDMDELKLPESESTLKFNFKTSNPMTDMENPTFKLGMTFSNPTELRKALANYIVKNRVKVRKTRDNAKRLEAICVEDCAGK
ncbi:uncharacterized protein LOC125517251 isoform X2 [Triticum urartu]|uniref:Transposase MuDR plant domain-containing protein n=1 Tax=Triticum urartu TaxID=4572 RepID=A0A8R7QM19_TRIUA|nr:uncharacterized protein LOC125517251 isoform X2 [Triticum urartu]